MEIIEFRIDDKVYTIEEVEGKYEVVVDSHFIGEMYKEKNKGWSWEMASEVEGTYPWEEIGKKIDKHIENMNLLPS